MQSYNVFLLLCTAIMIWNYHDTISKVFVFNFMGPLIFSISNSHDKKTKNEFTSAFNINKKMQQRNWQQIIKCPLVIWTWTLNRNVFITLNKFYFYSFPFSQANSMLYRQFSTKKHKQRWTSYSDSNAKQRMIVNERYQQYDRKNPMKKIKRHFCWCRDRSSVLPRLFCTHSSLSTTSKTYVFIKITSMVNKQINTHARIHSPISDVTNCFHFY